MLIIVKNNALMSGLTENEKQFISKYLTITNPLFEKRIELGLSNWNVPSNLKYFRSEGASSLFVPVGALPDILNLLQDNGSAITENDIIDARKTNQAPE